jgi:hypothetical protein
MKDNPEGKRQPADHAHTGPKRRGPTIKTIHQVGIEEWATMCEEERDKVKKKTAVVFGREVRAEPMNRLERVALWELYRRQGEKVHIQQMRGITERTQDRLMARGYVAMEGEKRRHWHITEQGIEAIKTTQEEPPPKVSKIWY